MGQGDITITVGEPVTPCVAIARYVCCDGQYPLNCTEATRRLDGVFSVELMCVMDDGKWIGRWLPDERRMEG